MAVNYQYLSDEIGFPPLNAANDTTQRLNLGRICNANDIGSGAFGEGEAVYVRFTGAVNAGDFVVTDRNGKTCVQLPNAAPGANLVSIAGVCLADQSKATAAAPTFGWVLLRGIHDGANVQTASATLGQVLSGGGGAAGRAAQGAANYILDGAVLRGAPVNNVGKVELYWPICSGR